MGIGDRTNVCRGAQRCAPAWRVRHGVRRRYGARVRRSEGYVITTRAAVRLRAAVGGGDVDLVARGIGDGPPGRGVPVVDHAATRGEGGVEALLRLVVGEPDDEVDRTVAIGARRVHGLEPERGAAVAGIDEVL